MALSDKLTTVADAIRSKTGKTAPLTLDQMATEINGITTTLFEDIPTAPGQWACLARASQMRDMKYVPKANMTADGATDVMKAGTEYTGVVYSSVRALDWGFIGYGVSMYSYLTALNNPKSIVYTKKYSDYFSISAEEDTTGKAYTGVSNVYGTNCSSYASYCFDLPYLGTTGTLKTMPCINEICHDTTSQAVDTTALQTELKLCDMLINSGHAVLVTGIRRNASGLIREVDISDSWPPRIRKKTYTWSAFVQYFITEQNYRVYRYTNLEKVTFPDNLTDIVYSDICTSRGDRVCIRPDQDISLNVLGNGYAGIALFKDGVQVSTQASTADWELSNLTTGKYTAVLYKAGEIVTIDDTTETNSTSFIVCDVSVSRNGTNYTYTAEAINGAYPTPMQIAVKNAAGFTLDVLLVDDDFSGEGSFVYEEFANGGIIQVPFKTEYGFVIAEYS